jgi:hypothetical protein
MEQPPTVTSGPAKPRPGLIILGVVFILVWAGVHYVLFLFTFAGAVLGDILLTIFRGTQLPGTMNPPREILTWVPFLQAAAILSGSAGVPAGLAMFWRSRRRLLLILAAVLFFLALPCALYAVYVLITTALLP